VTTYIAPSILAADFTRLGAHIREAEAGGADIIHIDVMDGRFVPNITMGPVVVAAARRSTRLPLDVHLMIIEPDGLLQSFIQTGASIVDVHVETCPNLHATLSTIRSLGCRAGVAINPHTPPVMLSEVMGLVDAVLVMTVNPGFGGQTFLPETLSKIRRIRAMIDSTGRDIGLSVDGGINAETAVMCVEAGANILVAGSTLFNGEGTLAENIDSLRQAVGE